MSFFITSTNVIFGFPLAISVPQRGSIHSFLLVHYSLSSKHDQTISRDFPSSFHQKELLLSLNECPHFESYLSIYSHLSILIFSFLHSFLWLYCLLTAQLVNPLPLPPSETWWISFYMHCINIKNTKNIIKNIQVTYQCYSFFWKFL